MDVSCISTYQDSSFWTPPLNVVPGIAASPEMAPSHHSATEAGIHPCTNVYQRPQKLIGSDEQPHSRTSSIPYAASHKLDFSATRPPRDRRLSTGEGTPTPPTSPIPGNGKKGQIWNGFKEYFQHHHQHNNSVVDDVDIEAQSLAQRSRSKSDANTQGRFTRLSFRRKRHTAALQKQISTEESSSSGGPLEEEEEESRDEPRPLFIDTQMANRVAEEGLNSPGNPQPGSYPNARKPGARPIHNRSRSNSGGENLLVLRNTSQSYLEILGKLDDPEEVYQQFLRTQSCYDLVPRVVKLVALDTKLTIRRAFTILRQHNLRAAPLWDGERMKYAGMLTQTDYLEMLSFTNTIVPLSTTDQDESMAAIDPVNDCRQEKNDTTNDNSGQVFANGIRHGSLLTLNEWFEKKPGAVKFPQGGTLSLDCNTKLLDAARVLMANHYHRVAVVDQESDNMMCLLSLKGILKLLQRNMYFLPIPTWMRAPLQVGVVGTWTNIFTITEDAPISEAIDRILTNRVSSLPVVDEVSGAITNILSKSSIMDLLSEILKQNDANLNQSASTKKDLSASDCPSKEMITSLAAEQLLSATVREATKALKSDLGDLAVCQPTDLLMCVIDKLATRSAARCVFVLDSGERPVAAISVSDVMGLLIS